MFSLFISAQVLELLSSLFCYNQMKEIINLGNLESVVAQSHYLTLWLQILYFTFLNLSSHVLNSRDHTHTQSSSAAVTGDGIFVV